MLCVSMLEGKMHHTQSASKSSFKVGQCLVKTCFLVAFCFCNCLNSFCHPSWGCGKEGKSNRGCLGLHFLGVHTNQCHFYHAKGFHCSYVFTMIYIFQSLATYICCMLILQSLIQSITY